jgi:hypothetical protein
MSASAVGPVFGADLLHDVLEARADWSARLAELVLDVLLAREQAHHALAGHLLYLGRKG